MWQRPFPRPPLVIWAYFTNEVKLSIKSLKSEKPFQVISQHFLSSMYYVYFWLFVEHNNNLNSNKPENMYVSGIRNSSWHLWTYILYVCVCVGKVVCMHVCLCVCVGGRCYHLSANNSCLWSLAISDYFIKKRKLKKIWWVDNQW